MLRRWGIFTQRVIVVRPHCAFNCDHRRAHAEHAFHIVLIHARSQHDRVCNVCTSVVVVQRVRVCAWVVRALRQLRVLVHRCAARGSERRQMLGEGKWVDVAAVRVVDGAL